MIVNKTKPTMQELRDLRGFAQFEIYSMFFTAWYFAPEEDKPQWRKRLEQLQRLWGHTESTSAIWENVAKQRLYDISLLLAEAIEETV